MPTAIQPCALPTAIQPCAEPPLSSPTAIQPCAEPLLSSPTAIQPCASPTAIQPCARTPLRMTSAIQPQPTTSTVQPRVPRPFHSPLYSDGPTTVQEADSSTTRRSASKPSVDSPRQTARRIRPVVSQAAAAKLLANGAARTHSINALRNKTLSKALHTVGLVMPASTSPCTLRLGSDTQFLLNKPLKAVLSEFIRRTRMPLPDFVELVRGQTADDYRPNKHLVPGVISRLCAGYPQLDQLQRIAAEGVRVVVKEQPSPQARPPSNHGSAGNRINVLRKNLRKEQDAWRCLVLDLDLLSLWPELVLSPFGVVDKADGDPHTTGRVIHDLSFPEGKSINDLTDQASIPRPDYQHCDAVAAEIVRLQRDHPDALIKLMAGDVACAFRNISIHSRSVHLFAGHLPSENALIIELSAPFGWTGSPGVYEVVGGAIAFVHGNHTNLYSPRGFFNYHWVDDHINAVADLGSNCADVERSLRFAMTAILGPEAVNEDKFTSWNTTRTMLGLQFDSVTRTVSMPEAKILKARHLVATAFHSHELTRKHYRSLLGSLRHVATCIRSARPFLQRLRRRESQLNRFQTVAVSDPMKQDLLWWWHILHSSSLNGVSLAYFNGLPDPDVLVEMDASDFGLCALDTDAQEALTYQFSPVELQLIADFKAGAANGFNINFRELLSCAFAAHTWGRRWSRRASSAGRPVHICFQIDNTSAVAWQNRLSSANARAQDILRLLGYWERSLNLRFSARHVAGVANVRADAGSRLSANASYASRFHQLTRGWSQVSPTLDVHGLSMIWHSISASIPLPTPPSPGTRPL